MEFEGNMVSPEAANPPPKTQSLCPSCRPDAGLVKGQLEPTCPPALSWFPEV